MTVMGELKLVAGATSCKQRAAAPTAEEGGFIDASKLLFKVRNKNKKKQNNAKGKG